MVVFLGWCLVVVFLWWCSCRCVCVVVLLWWCFCGGVFALVFLCWCFCGGVSVVVFLWWCFCGVVAVVFLWWCFCGGVFVVVFLWWCFCGGVFVVVFLWWCTKYYSSTTKYYSSTTKYYSVLQSTTPYYKVLLQYYSVLQKYYSSTTPYYRALLQPLKRRQNDVLPVYYSVLRQYYKSFQNEHFVRGFRNFSRNKLPKRAFRAMPPTIFREKASKRIVSCEASSKFHRRSFQNERFVRCFLQNSRNKLPKRAFRAMLPTILTEKASKMIISCEASSKFHRTVLPKRAFRAMLPTIFTKNWRFATVSRNRHTASCERVHPPKAKCASHYNAVHSQM